MSVSYVSLAVEAYARCVAVAFPICVVFHLGNRLLSTVLRAFTGGELRF